MAKRRAAHAASTAAAAADGGNTQAPPRASKSARTRERLVDAAKQIFEEHGFLDARITDISERAGQSHGVFYYYFDSKEEIFREVAAAVDEQLAAPLEDVILARNDQPPQERIREAMRRHFESYKREARIIDLIEHVSRIDPEVNAMRLARHKRFTEQVADTIRQLQRRRVADATLDPVLTAAALGALTHRFAEMWLVHGAIDSSLKHAVEQLSRIFANALRLKT